jgi:hypothetical protein
VFACNVMMSPEGQRGAYYGFFYGLVFGGLLTGASVADTEAGWTEVLQTAAVAILVFAPTLAAIGFVVGLVYDRMRSLRADRMRSKNGSARAE